MNILEFYKSLSAIDFTLFGLWWAAVYSQGELRAVRGGIRRASHVVLLQFAIPGTAGLLVQVDPGGDTIWRLSFALAGSVGALGLLLLQPALSGTSRLILPALGVPLHCSLVVVAVAPKVVSGWFGASALQVAAVLSVLVLLLGVQTAWTAAMPASSREME